MRAAEIRKRPRVALLVDAISARYQVQITAGARHAALSAGADFICFIGGYFTVAGTVSSRYDGSFIYDLAGAPAIDGLVVAANILATEVGTEWIAGFCARRGVPVVGIGELYGFPHVAVDNKSGLRTVIEHMIVEHGRRRFAFIQGAAGNPDSAEREETWRETLGSHGLEVREELVLPGDFLEASGTQAVRELFDHRGIRPGEVDAIVAANDPTAAGVLNELDARRIRVPDDIALVGFDDDDHARFCNPPLTTVRQPAARLGERAVELLMARLDGRPTPEQALVATEPVLRRSCGCAAVGRLSEPADPRTSANVTHCVDDLRQICRDEAQRVFGPDQVTNSTGGVDHLMDALAATLGGKALDLGGFEQAVAAGASSSEDPLRWHDVLQIAEAALVRCRTMDTTKLKRGEELLLRARVLVSGVAARVNLVQQLRTVQESNALRILGGALVSAADLRSMGRILLTALSDLGIRFCAVCLFQEGDAARTDARLLVSHHAARLDADAQLPAVYDWWRTTGHFQRLPPPSVRPEAPVPDVFPAELLLPREHEPEDPEPAARVVHALTFAREPLGYVIFDLPPDISQAWVADAIAGHLSDAVYVLLQAETLRRARIAAEVASAAKTQFVAAMSHEVRTPITAVIGYLDLASRTSLSAQQRRYLTQAQLSSQALLEVINDILDFSKIEADRLDLERTQFELDDVLDRIASACGMAAARKNLELVLDVAENVPEILVGDPLRLGQVLLNLVGNAVKFTDQGEVVLKITEVDRGGDGVRLQFSVRDTGIGMRPEQLERLATPFTQADSSTTRRYGGTGLGLAISQRLLRRMGAELAADSQFGQGTTFCFDLEFPIGGEQSPTRVRPEPGGHRVLIVDNLEISRRLLGRLLHHHGFDTGMASSVVEALTLLETVGGHRRFDLVLINQGLPGEGGLGIARRIRSRWTQEDTAVLLMAAFSDPEVFAQDLELGIIQGVVSKPMRRREFWRVLQDALSGNSRISIHSDRSPFGVEKVGALRGRRVLWVQDDPITREMGRELLELGGIDVTIADDGQKAVELVRSKEFDAVLMDLQMPVMDGFEATRLIRQELGDRPLPIIAVTASALSEDRVRCLAAGMNDHLAIPLDPARLFGVLLRWLGTDTPAADPGEGRARPASSLPTRPSRRPPANLDTTTALDRLGGKRELYRRLLRRLWDDCTHVGPELHAALDLGDYESVRRRVHTLASAAANVGAEKLTAAAQRLERELACRGPGTVELLSQLERSLMEVLPEIATMSGGSSAPPSSGYGGARVPGALRAELDRLLTLVEQCDTRAVECVDALATGGVHRGLGEDLQRLVRTVQAYDFDQATAQLRTLLSRLDVSGA